MEEVVAITAAHVLLGRHREQNPPFTAAVHLEVPGPDIHAAGSDHTLAAAFKKVREALHQEVALRHGHRRQNQKTRLKIRRQSASI